MAPRDDGLARTVFTAGQGLLLDESYRRCHLPLVNPNHPDAIASGAGYEMGRHKTVASLVLPLPADRLDKVPAFQEMESELRSSPLTDKVAWEIGRQRRGKLHATLAASPISEGWRDRLRAFGPLRVQVAGAFSGRFNIGRIYLPIAVAAADGGSALHVIQDAVGHPRRDACLCGLWNLSDHLTPDEAAWLQAWLARWGDRTICQLTARELWVLKSRDDLVLDSEVDEVIELG